MNNVDITITIKGISKEAHDGAMLEVEKLCKKLNMPFSETTDYIINVEELCSDDVPRLARLMASATSLHISQLETKIKKQEREN